MHMAMHDVLGWFSVVCAAIGYGDYLRTMIKRQTKPHVLTWAVWGVVISIIFVAQWQGGGGAGTWGTGLSAAACLLIAGLALPWGEKNMARSDWAAFIAALTIIPVWHFTKNPLVAVVLATMIDALAYYPTFRKSYHKPGEENVFLYSIGLLQWGVSVFAMQDASPTTLIYPIFCVTANSGLVAMVAWRRYSLR